MSERGHPRRQRLRYRLLQLWARLAALVVYRRIDVTGAHHLAGDRPIVLAPNHTNGFADIAVIVAKVRRFPRFGAAASWWKSAPARLLFDFAGVLPIYRGRDGSTKKNVGTFAALHEALAAREPVVIFPEGEMNLEPSLLPLRTGAARIALGAGAPHVALVPVGLVYEDRGRFRSDVEVHFDEPIEIDDWLELYTTARHKAVRGVTAVLTERLAAATVTHGSRAEAALLDRATAIVVGTKSYADRTALRRTLAASIAANGGSDSAEYAKLAAAVESYDARVAEAPLDPRVVAGLAALAPAAAFGFVTNAPVVAGAWIASARVPNEGWRASATGVAGTVLVPLVWSAEYAAAAHWWGRRRARMFVAATAVGGIAAVALYDRWQHRRDTAPAADNEVAAVVASLTETRTATAP